MLCAGAGWQMGTLANTISSSLANCATAILTSTTQPSLHLSKDDHCDNCDMVQVSNYAQPFPKKISTAKTFLVYRVNNSNNEILLWCCQMCSCDVPRVHVSTVPRVMLQCATLQVSEMFAPYFKYCAEQTACQQYCKDQDRDNQIFKAYLAVSRGDQRPTFI